MQPVATINGKKVYSDKGVAAIVNTRVQFTDGSWCDVATGEVVNKGSGYINIGAPASEGDSTKTTRGPQTYAASALEVRNLNGTDVSIEVSDRNGIEVEVTGPKSYVEQIALRTQGDMLLIEGPQTADNGGGISVISDGGRSVVRVGGVSGISGLSISGGSIIVGSGNVIMTGGEESETHVTVRIPKGTPVTAGGITGKTDIGNIDAPLSLNATLSGDYYVGRVTDANINVQGSSDIHIKEVRGNVALNVMGSGDIEIGGGAAQMLTVSIMGSGDVDFRGKAVNANLTIMGSGDMYVAHVENRPSTNRMGSGRLKIGNW